jgi:hypothetical protein
MSCYLDFLEARCDTCPRLAATGHINTLGGILIFKRHGVEGVNVQAVGREGVKNACGSRHTVVVSISGDKSLYWFQNTTWAGGNQLYYEGGVGQNWENVRVIWE